jgi:hypothetical protein
MLVDGAGYPELIARAVPANPSTNNRTLFVDSTNSNHLSVRTSAGATVDVESGVSINTAGNVA